MRVFITGGTGFVGTAVVQELIRSGHEVIGLARSESASASLTEAGAEVHRGDLENLESLRSGAESADGVIHCGFIHDFSRFEEVCKVDGLAIEAMGAVLLNTNKPLIITSGTALVSPGQIATEEISPPFAPSGFPRASEEAGRLFAERGVRVITVRLSPSVHGDGDHGFVPSLIGLAREKGASAYVGEGLNRWTAVHRLDAGVLYRLALEHGAPGSKFHGVAEEGIPFRDIAEAIGKGLNVPVVSKSPEEAAEHFGWFAGFAGLDCPASSKLTRERLSWIPTHCSLVQDLESGTYFSG